jgi:hypothetical protein
VTSDDRLRIDRHLARRGNWHHNIASGGTAVVTRARDLGICSRSPVALPELSDYLRMAANELERAQR